MGREDFQFKYYQNMRTSVALYIYVGVSVKNIRGEWQPEIHVIFTYAYHTLKQQAHYVI